MPKTNKVKEKKEEVKMTKEAFDEVMNVVEVINNSVRELHKKVDVIGNMVYDMVRDEEDEEDYDDDYDYEDYEKPRRKSNVEAKIDGE